MDDFSSARPNTEAGCPILQGVCFVTFRVSHHRFMGCLVPKYGSFESFRVSEHRFMGSLPSGGSIKDDRIKSGCLTPAFLEAGSAT